MWHCVISGGVIACQSARKCFKYYNLWYAVRFAWCYWEKISKFNIFHFLPASAVSVSDNFSSPHGDSRWGREKWLEVTVWASLSETWHSSPPPTPTPPPPGGAWCLLVDTIKNLNSILHRPLSVYQIDWKQRRSRPSDRKSRAPGADRPRPQRELMVTRLRPCIAHVTGHRQ